MPHKLLLADDSVTIQRVIELTFADEDVHVVAVGDGKKAIESIQANRPDIVLADVGMPERDGYEVAEFVKRNPELANIPVVLLTGAFEPIDETRARAVGCDGVLVKPFEPQMVINRVKDLLAGRRSGGLWGAKPAVSPDRVPAPTEKAPSTPPAAAAPAASASLEEYFDRLDAAFASVEAATEARSAAAAIPPPAPAVISTPSAAASTSAASLSTDDLPGWDPDLMGDPQRPAAGVAAPTQPPPIQVRPFVEPAPAPEPPPVQQVAPPPPPAVAAQASAPPAAPIIPTVAPKPPVAEPAVAVATPPPIERPAPAVPRPAITVPHAPASGSIPSLAEAFAALLSAEQARRVSPSTVGSPAVSDDMVEAIVQKVVERMTDQAVRDTVLDVAERLVREEIGRIKTGH